MLGSLHDTLAPLHSRDIQRRDHGRDAEDGRLGPLTFAARPATVFAFSRTCGPFEDRAARRWNRENGTRSLSRLSRTFLNTCPEARPLTPPAREKFFSSLDLHVSVLKKNTRVLTRFANAPASASSRLVFAQASFFRGPVARGVRAGRWRAVFTDTGHAERERKYTYTCDCKTNFSCLSSAF